MDWVTLAELLLKYGPDVVNTIVTNAHNNAPVTPEAWQALLAKINTPAKDL